MTVFKQRQGIAAASKRFQDGAAMRPALNVSTVVFVLAIIFPLSSVTGCASATTTFRSKTDLADTAPIERLLVVANVKSRGFGDRMYQGFESDLTRRLQACGVQSRIVPADVMDIDLEQRVAQAKNDLAPGAALSIVTNSADLVIQGSAVQGGEIFFDLKIVDLESSKEIWLARSSLKFAGTGSTAAGGRFATSIVSRLRADGVLPRCPAPEPGSGWTCEEEREQALNEASRTEDRKERMEKMKAVPTCK